MPRLRHQVTANADPTGPCALPNSGVSHSEGVTDWTKYIRPVGTVPALMLLVDFPDAPAGETPLGRYSDYLPRAADYFRTSSYGTLNLDVRYTPFHRLPRPVASYGIKRGMSGDVARAFFAAAVAAADSAVDFRSYKMIYVVPTRTANLPFMASVNWRFGLPVQADGVPLRDVAFMFGTGDFPNWWMVLNHETAHSFDLPDLYDTAGSATAAFAGGWDMMSEYSYAPDFLAWHKWKMGWLDSDQVACVSSPGSSSHMLSPLAMPGGTKLLVMRTGTNTVLAVEIRTRQGGDRGICGEGVLAYTVDASVGSGKGPVKVLDFSKTAGCGWADDPFQDATIGVGGWVGVGGYRVDVAGRDLLGNYTVQVSKN